MFKHSCFGFREVPRVSSSSACVLHKSHCIQQAKVVKSPECLSPVYLGRWGTMKDADVGHCAFERTPKA